MVNHRQFSVLSIRLKIGMPDSVVVFLPIPSWTELSIGPFGYILATQICVNSTQGKTKVYRTAGYRSAKQGGIQFDIDGTINVNSQHQSAKQVVLTVRNNQAILDKTRQIIKVDVTNGDRITPRAVEYSFRLLFENRSISILAYNLETVLAEKFETILSRSTASTRMRDYYDVYILTKHRDQDIDWGLFTERY
jgi:hypothetical protein